MATFPFGFSPRQKRVTWSVGVGAPRNALIRHGRARAFHAPGIENISPLGRTRRGRPSSSSGFLLPTWYPRRPLKVKDITSIVRIS
ncbi:hypothetical protein SESBI_30030 [Sesbania bispinosa]|nr:hypothetical protein SESBI_30030 [Sesbania bispinosa]